MIAGSEILSKGGEIMNDLNSILIEGNLTRDPVLTNTPTGTAVCNFALASHVNLKRNAEQVRDTSYFDVEAWQRLGENCAEYLRKGRGVRVVGRLKQDRWRDGEGRPRSRVKIVAEHVEFRPMKRDVDKDAEGESEANIDEASVRVFDSQAEPSTAIEQEEEVLALV